MNPSIGKNEIVLLHLLNKKLIASHLNPSNHSLNNEEIRIQLTIEDIDECNLRKSDFCTIINILEINKFLEVKQPINYKRYLGEPDGVSLEYYVICLSNNFDELFNKCSNKELISKNQKMNIFISEDKGIYKMPYNKKLSYQISIKSKRFSIIKKLKNEKVSGDNLMKECGYDDYSSLAKEIIEINELFKKKLKLKNDLIIHISTNGYSLNKESFDIKFEN